MKGGRPGTREDNEKGRRDKIITREARRAGNIYLLFELHRALPGKWTDQSNLFFEILRMLEDTEGFANAIVGDSAELNLNECRKHIPQIALVVDIIEYIIRYDQLPEDKRTVEAAKHFVAKKHPSGLLGTDPTGRQVNSDDRPGVKSLEKIWAEFVVAAPLLYGLLSDREFNFRIFEHIEEAIRWTKTLCADQARVTSFLGRAATVAHTLKANRVRTVRVGYYKGIECVDLQVESFAPEELKFIEEMDPKAIADDGAHYKAPIKMRR